MLTGRWLGGLSTHGPLPVAALSELWGLGNRRLPARAAAHVLGVHGARDAAAPYIGVAATQYLTVYGIGCRTVSGTFDTKVL